MERVNRWYEGKLELTLQIAVLILVSEKTKVFWYN